MQIFSLLIVILGLIFAWEKARWILFVVGGVLVVMAFLSYQSTKKGTEKRQEVLRVHKKQLSDLLDMHTATLSRKFRQSVYKDDYGQFVFDRWQSERSYFIDKVLALESPSVLQIVGREDVEGSVDERVLYLLNVPAHQLDVDAMSPTEFEQYCASLLEGAGWKTRLTRATGDQGVDIVGTRNSVSVAFQCKKYSSPVGNAAVQEVLAGQVFEGAQAAAVVTNSSYTRAARELAHSAGVHLLHFDELSSFEPVAQSTGA